ncbi:ATP-dependent DNA helicase MPH1 [Ophiocordyceps camponoti-floridani]|uniref:ATP-dependent DNA helicase n=1 Tax=Ophiocordyceps camponoti-floridani TaxID=2030778 RepID=A0A8H4VGA1_9HYPO|nr:ATP-dependent DNA helicase MPH1 [Ophiocordyceps camponoti-floridani]
MGEDFDDDLADEDLLTALEQLPSGGGEAAPNRSNKSITTVELPDSPPDVFSSSTTPRQPVSGTQVANHPAARRGLQRVSSSNYRQTTLWGSELSQETTQPPSSTNRRTARADLPPEEPSHHELDRAAMRTWVYPTNLGTIRDYQYSIVRNSLFNNTLVALPTGLGKTFIAATVMLNFYRWTKSSKIVFVAPTKPLVAQQVDACYNIVGIPRSETTLLTGNIQPALRVDEWRNRRVFFMTPQTLLNDLSRGYADPKAISLMVIDEAHRAVGEYAYAKATKFIRRFSNSFRVLALTATPGSKIETVQEIIDNLGISHCEIRTEESIDIRQYVHQRNVESVVLDPSDEMNLISELFTAALKPLMDKLTSQNIYYGRNPMALTAYGLMQAQREWLAKRGPNANQGVQFMMRAVFSVLTGLAHSIKLLNFHGIKPFYDNLVDFRSEQEERGEKGSKYRRQLIDHPSFQEMMSKISAWLKRDGFVGHPKLTALADRILNHFMDRGQESATRVIVFSEYRDSAEDIVRMLNKHRPLIKASVFVGQADGKRGEGMKQTQQIQTLERFKKGDFNVLVATSIGEEGLDIGQVDLIICYDASASPIRMLQRMGRTGRKRAGNIVLLLMRGKEEDQFAKSKVSYEKMQELICEGSRFNFRADLSNRIVPRDIRPEVDKRHVDIPVENTQDDSLPEPRKRRAPAGKKMPPKKFHMPDGVETGFQSVSQMWKKTTPKTGAARPQRDPELEQLADIPGLESVTLSAEETRELDRSYRDLPFNHSMVEETDMPSLVAHPQLQRRLQPVGRVKHGSLTKRCVAALNRIGSRPEELVRRCRELDTSSYREIPVKPFICSDGEEEGHEPSDEAAKRKSATTTATSTRGTAAKRKRRAPQTPASPRAQQEDSEEEFGLPKRRRRQLAKGSRARGINSDELGDDCEQESDLRETSDSDDGADLADFVVTDDRIASSAATRSTPAATDDGEKKPFFVPTRFSPSQESDGFPDLAELTSSSKRPAGRDTSMVDLAGDEDASPKARRRRRRLAESDSDD